jgi:hypothetical protein
MRVTRILAALVALMLAAALPLIATGSATASSEKQTVSAKKTRGITFQFRAQNKTYSFKGAVSPKAKSKFVPVKLLRASCKNCRYHVFRSTRTNNRAKYAFTGLKKTGWFTVRIPASRGFAASFASKSIHVFIN